MRTVTYSEIVSALLRRLNALCKKCPTIHPPESSDISAWTLQPEDYGVKATLSISVDIF
jgi:hypothetical protein